MSASSLIFVVIFAVWAAYMLKHWVRRREDLATARSVDRFSEAMRMLERRAPVKADLSPREGESRPGILRRGAATSQAEDRSTEHTGASAVGALGRAKGSAAAGARRVAGGTSRISLTSPEAKLGALLTAAAFFLITLVLAPFGVVPMWLPLLGLAATGGMVVWLRRTAVKNRAARAGVRHSSPEAVGPEASTQAGAATKAGSTTGASAPQQPIVDDASSQPRRSEPRRSPLVAEHVVSQDVVFDQEPDMNAAARAEAQVFDAGWNPVDVPRPTYTMKAKAGRAEVAPAATSPMDVRPLAARYENTPVAELPFDGMALDEDYEELPQVYRAG